VSKDRVYKTEADNYSSCCTNNAHKNCSGFKRSNHGIKPLCGCPCHRRRPSADEQMLRPQHRA